MRNIRFRRIPETIALMVCIGLLLAAWAPADPVKSPESFDVSTQDDNAGTVILAGKSEWLNENEILTVSDEEFELLAQAVYSEARGEPFQGQVAIAAVILNRIENPDFPDSIRAVIFEPWAFTAVHDGQFWLTPDETAYEAVSEALAGNDPTEGAIYYYNPVTATNQWIRSRAIITTIGKHVFAI